MIYIDASVLMPLLVTEKRTVEARVLGKREDLFVSDFAAGEVVSALSRLVRMEYLREQDADRLCERFEAWRLTSTAGGNINVADVALGTAYVRKWALKLRLPDAINLAACKRLGFALATFDVRLEHAARAIEVALAKLN